MWLINYAVIVMCEQCIKRFSGFSASASARWGGAWEMSRKPALCVTEGNQRLIFLLSILFIL
jgi:hypothetical protein